MFRSTICRFLSLSLLATAAVALPEQAAADHETTTILFEGGGWGHGVGMSQYGALGRAEAGILAEDILEYYYDGTSVEPREAEITQYLGDGVRVKLVNRLTRSHGEVRDDVTVTVDPELSTTPGLLTVTMDNQVIENIGSSVRLEQGERVEGTDRWRWYLWVDGIDECTGCEARAPEVSWPDGTVVGVGQNYGTPTNPRYEYKEHDEGVIVFDSGTGADSTAQITLRIGLDAYLGALAEMPGHWHVQALRAQAIAGRSYVLLKAIANETAIFDVYDTTQDQVYGGANERNAGRTEAATTGPNLVVTYEGEVIQTFYSSSNGGWSESTENSSSYGTPQPYHISKPDPYDSAPDETGAPQNPNARRTFEFTRAQISEWLAEYSSADLDVGIVQRVTVDDLPPSGRITNALVTVYGSNRTIEVRGINGVYADPDQAGYDDLPPFGLRFQAAIQRGCEADNRVLPSDEKLDCPRSSNFSVAGFFDISPDDFFYAPVLWMASEGITDGVGENEFGPYQQVTRAQFAAFVHRFMGEPEPIEPSGFVDVADTDWFADPVSWMRENDITTGTTPTTFSPGLLVTRGQLATFLYRIAGEPEVELSGQFVDVPPGRFFSEAVAWMVEFGITNGTSATTFSPDEVVTRGQIATFLYRLAGLPAAFADGTPLPAKMRAT